MFRILALLILASSAFSGVANAAAEPCVQETEALMSIKSSWKHIYREASALPFGCFDGDFGEGISDTIVRKMGKDWPGFLHTLAAHRNNKRFFSVVLDSFNATLDPDDIQTVYKLSKKSCPSALGTKCQEISRRAVEALADYDPPISPSGL